MRLCLVNFLRAFSYFKIHRKGTSGDCYLSLINSIKHEGPLTPEKMKEKGLIKKLHPVKILGNGDLTGALTIHAHKFSKSALSKIERSGGKAVVL